MDVKKIVAAGFAFIIAVVLLLVIFTSSLFFTIDAGERGVLLRNGTVVEVLDSGLHFKFPFIEDVKVISTRSNLMSYQNIQAYSKDQQPANLNVSVTYSVPVGDTQRLYMQYQTVEGMLGSTLNRQVLNQVENTFGQYNAVAVVTKREQFVADVTNNIRASLEGVPITIELVQVENITFSQAYERSIEQRMQAEVEVETKRQNLAEAQIEAQIVTTRAQADADSVLIRADADAKAIDLKTAALERSQNYVQLVIAERWDGKLPVTMLPNSTLPFIEIEK